MDGEECGRFGMRNVWKTGCGGVVLCLCLGMMSCYCIRILPETGLRDTIRRIIEGQRIRGNSKDKVHKLRIVM